MPTARQATKPVQKHQPRSAKGMLTRSQLVNAAKQVFERDGLLNARITDISKRAKISYGAFYHYFGSKEELFRELAKAQEDRLTAPPDRSEISTGQRSIEDRIRNANRRFLERYRAEAALMGKIEQASRVDPHVNAVRKASQEHFAERSERTIRQLQSEGKADPRINPAIASVALGAMVGRFAELWLSQGYREYDFDEVVEQMSILWTNALGVKAPSPTRNSKTRQR